jgi:lysophospholipase L1-like esterase
MHTGKSQKNRFKNFFFAIIALLLPLVFLTLTELGLRNTDLYRRIGLFTLVKVEGKSWYLAQSSFATRYFGNFEPSVALNPFAAEANKDVFRIFVLGGSTTAGYPHNFGFGFPQQLELMLKQARPDVRTEVINLGMTAINSYTVWDIARRLHRYEPDLIIVYSGHNEYYGAYGAGSTAGVSRLNPALKRMIIQSLDLAVVQWARHFVYRMSGIPGYVHSGTGIAAQGSTDGTGITAQGSNARLSGIANTGRSDTRSAVVRSGRIDERIPQRTTTMQQMIRDSNIEFGGKVYQRGLRQFESNMHQVARITGKYGIPVIISTVSSNLKDQPPLSSDATALEVYANAYRLFEQGDTPAARVQYQKAKDLDRLRFRAPGGINDVIREISETYEHIKLIDLESEIDAESVSGLADGSFFTDHLHPGVVGYRFMAQELIKTVMPFMPVYSGAMECLRFPDSEAVKLVPDSFELHLAELNLQILLSGYPFDREIDTETHQLFILKLLEESEVANNPAGLKLAARFLREGGHPVSYYQELLREFTLYSHTASQNTGAGQRAQILPPTRPESANSIDKRQSETSLFIQVRADGESSNGRMDTASWISQYIRTATATALWSPLDFAQYNEYLSIALPLNPEFSELEPLLLLASVRTGDPLYFNILAALYLQREDMRRACAFLEVTEKLVPDNPDLLNNMIIYHLAAGDTLKARNYYLRATNRIGPQ